MINKIKKYIYNPKLGYIYFINKGFFNWMSDETFIKFSYRVRMGKKINLKTPKTFNEKLQWLKLYNRKDIYTTMVDKYEVKEYVLNIIGKEYIIPTLGIYNKFNDINFAELPNQFVLKSTHDSGGIVICKDKSKFNSIEAKKKLNISLKRNYYEFGREWPYKNVKPRIIVEQYMQEEKNQEIKDYKFFCFNGKVKFFKVDFERFEKHKANYFDINGKILLFGEVSCPPDFNKKIDLPMNLNEMIILAEKIAKNISFSRVDFYNVNGKIYFGEITFFPASGFGEFMPAEWDEKIGDMLRLPEKKEKYEK